MPLGHMCHLRYDIVVTAAAVQKTRFFAFERIFFVIWLYNTYLFHISIFFLAGWLVGKWQRKETCEAEQLYYYQYYFSISNLIFILFFRIDNAIPYIDIYAPFYIRLLFHSFWLSATPHYHVHKRIAKNVLFNQFIHTFSFIHFSIFVQIERFHYIFLYSIPIHYTLYIYEAKNANVILPFLSRSQQSTHKVDTLFNALNALWVI